MNESAGAATLAIALALIGFMLIVAGVRGTYSAVWSAITSAPPSPPPQGSGGKSTVK